MFSVDRDVIETRLDLGGFPVVVTDTAGLREDTDDVIEAEGVKRSVRTFCVSQEKLTLEK